jgi:cardiolipin synthase
MFANKKPGRYLYKKFTRTERLITQNLKQEDGVIERMPLRDGTRAHYLKNMGYPVYSDTEVRYFASGEQMMPHILEELSGARHFIFLEYFIIEEGKV